VRRCLPWGSGTRRSAQWRWFLAGLAVGLATIPELRSQPVSVVIDTSPAGRNQVIDGFGTCLSGTEGLQGWWQSLFFDDLQCTILRMDLTPAFKAPYTGMNGTYNSPWFHNNPPLPGPDTNNVRTYSNTLDYTRVYNGWRAPIAVMGPDIDQNTNNFDFTVANLRVAGQLAQIGMTRGGAGDFKLIGSLWSPAPWIKGASGNKISGQSGVQPVNGTAFPFIWYNNFSGGMLDTSGVGLTNFDDTALGGTGPTSALMQFARCTAAYLRGVQRTFGVQFYAFSIQNELNFEEFYNSCTYPLSAGYLAALKAVRAELDKYADLAPIRIMGPEDLLGADAYALWQYGAGSSTVHKNLQYLANIAADPIAAAAESFFCIHGYASDGVSAAGATPTSWNWWAGGWSSSPAAGIPANISGFRAYGKKSWMTETSGEDPAWLSPAAGYPGNGAWSIAVRIHQALTVGQESAWVYWQLTDGNPNSGSTLTSAAQTNSSPKYVAAKHYFRWIRPGAVRVNANVAGTTNLLVSAYLHETNATMTVVMINTTSNAMTCQLAVPSQPIGIKTWQVFTSSNGSYGQTSSVSVLNGTSPVPVPGYGVVTLSGVGSPRLRSSLAPGSQLNLSWPGAATDFVLQSKASLDSEVMWQVLSNLPASNGWFNVSVAATNPSGFFRLATKDGP
jgi:O-glycosyl hydrolase